MKIGDVVAIDAWWPAWYLLRQGHFEWSWSWEWPSGRKPRLFFGITYFDGWHMGLHVGKLWMGWSDY